MITRGERSLVHGAGALQAVSRSCIITNEKLFFRFVRSGRFVTLEAARNEDQGDYAGSGADPQREITGVLLSPRLEHGEWSCLRLVYQITESGSLEVLQRTEGNSFDRPLWSSRSSSDSWVVSSIDLQNNAKPYRVTWFSNIISSLFV